MEFASSLISSSNFCLLVFGVFKNYLLNALLVPLFHLSFQAFPVSFPKPSLWQTLNDNFLTLLEPCHLWFWASLCKNQGQRLWKQLHCHLKIWQELHQEVSELQHCSLEEMSPVLVVLKVKMMMDHAFLRFDLNFCNSSGWFLRWLTKAYYNAIYN